MSAAPRHLFAPRVAPRWFRIGLACQVAVGLLAVLVAIGDAPFWRDEVASVSVAQRSFGGIFQVLGHTDANAGLYYLLLHAWMWGGQSEGWVRALSALLTVATVPVTALLGRRLAGDAVGLVAGFLLAGSSLVVLFAQSARGYALALLLTALSTLFFVGLCNNDRRRSVAIGYVAASTLAVYANLFSGLVLLVHVASLAFHPCIRPLMRRFSVLYGAIFLVASPLAVFLLLGASDQVSWIARPTLGDLASTAQAFLGPGNAPLALLAGCLVVVGLVALWRGEVPGDERPELRRWRFVLLAGWMMAPPALLFAVSQAKPLYDDRYLTAIAPAVAVVGAVGLVALAQRSRPIAFAAAVALVCLSVVVRADLKPLASEDLRGAAAMIADQSQPGDGIAYAPAYARVGLDWYLRRTPVSKGAVPDDFAIANGGDARQVGDLYSREVAPTFLARRLVRHPRIWLLSYPGSGWHPTPEPMLEAGVRALDEQYSRARAIDFGGARVELYVRRP